MTLVMGGSSVSRLKVTAPAAIVLVLEFAAVAVTFTVIVQVLLPKILPPVKPIEDAPAFAVKVPAHVLVAPVGLAMTRPEGKVSLNATELAVTPTPLLLPMVIVRTDVLF